MQKPWSSTFTTATLQPLFIQTAPKAILEPLGDHFHWPTGSVAYAEWCRKLTRPNHSSEGAGTHAQLSCNRCSKEMVHAATCDSCESWTTCQAPLNRCASPASRVTSVFRSRLKRADGRIIPFVIETGRRCEIETELTPTIALIKTLRLEL